MRFLFALALLVCPTAFAQTLQCAPVGGGTYQPLDGASLPSGAKCNVRVLPCPSTMGWTSALDGKAVGIVENQCPIEAGGDNFLVAFTDGSHTFTMTDGTTTLTAKFTVGAPSPPAPKPTTGTMVTWDLPVTFMDGSALTGLVGIRVYLNGAKLVDLPATATSYKASASGTYYLTAFTATAESGPSPSVAFVLAPPPVVGPVVIAVVPGANMSPVFGITSTNARSSTVLGFVPVGKLCTGSAIYSYRGAKYFRFTAADALWWQSTATTAAAVACQ